MEIFESIANIKTFWNGDLFIPHGAGKQRLVELQNEFEIIFPEELQEYIINVAPIENVLFEGIGNPFEIYGTNRLGVKQDGYTYNSVTNEPINDWLTQWFLFADEGADPIIVDLSEPVACVKSALHGTGEWEFEKVADSIGQFLLCCAAIHHALTNWGPDVIIDDENSLYLAAEPAKWLFPKMKSWAGDYYLDWCSAFDNH